jgi:DNA ligase D-like protein (predicted ligase)
MRYIRRKEYMKFDIREIISQTDHKKLISVKQPQWIEPMLAYLEHNLFFDKNWFYERKLDGERCLAFINEDGVHLYSRNNKSLNEFYPELAQALKDVAHTRCILDGEIVAFQGTETSFEKLAKRMHQVEEAGRKLCPVYYYLFDIMYVDQYDCTQLPLRSRKKILKKVITFNDPVRYSTHRISDCENYFRSACRRGWEGLMCKDPESSYVHVRSTSWLKFKCVANQELVIGGFTDPQGSRIGFGALLLGYYDDKGNLYYAGKVGTGFDDELLASLGADLKKIEIVHCPFVCPEHIKDNKVHWVKPELVAEIGFTEWTADNKLRHPRFEGLRYDKSARAVRQEK